MPAGAAAAADAADAAAAAAEAKEEGNRLFIAKDYTSAIACYTRAISLDPHGPQTHVFYSNRASCHAALGQWAESKEDAQACVALVPSTFPKGYLRLAKACLELGQLGAANDALCKGLALDPESPDLRRVERAVAAAQAQEVARIKTAIDPRLRPTPAELQTVGELGRGNFTRILHVVHRGTKEHFALKVIEKAQIARVKARHPNVANEINMERRLLSRLRGHPNLVELYHAFQDHDSLYYLLEYCPGGEVWQRLQLRTRTGASVSVGVAPSLARFWTAEVAAALEFLHGKGVVHRDVKPENMVLTEKGRLKLIDFGSAKDLVETDLNGPEFVGTPEYMSPEATKSRAVGTAADLWALGCCLYQFLTGFSPFKGPSPYLVFLRSQRACPHCPAVIPATARDLILRLIRKRPQDRLGAADHADPASRGFGALRAHPFFAGLAPSTAACPVDESIVSEPTPRESMLRALSGQCLEEALSAALAPSPEFVEAMAGLSPEERAFVAHPLERQGKLAEARVLRLALTTGLTPLPARVRSLARLDRHGRGAYGLGPADQGKYRGPFFLLHLAGLQVAAGSSSVSARLELLKRAALAINRLRPRVVVASVDALVADVLRGEGGGGGGGGGKEEEVEEAVWEALGKVSESIPVLPVPQSSSEEGGFGFWFGGVRGLVTSAGAPDTHAEPAAADKKEEEDWLVEELEQGRYHDRHLLAFAPGPWFCPSSSSHTEKQQVSPRLARWALARQQGRATRLRAVLAPAADEVEEGGQVLSLPGVEVTMDGGSDSEHDEDEDKGEEEEEEEEDGQGHSGVRQVRTAGACLLEVYRDRVVPRFVGLEELASGAVTVELQPEAPRAEDEEESASNYVIG